MSNVGIKCPYCGNPRCSMQSMNGLYWVWCIAPRCNKTGPLCNTPEKALDEWVKINPKEGM